MFLINASSKKLVTLMSTLPTDQRPVSKHFLWALYCEMDSYHQNRLPSHFSPHPTAATSGQLSTNQDEAALTDLS